ncbi:ribosome recycling factor [Natronogracilivirgula saccharolytica]|uniref:Ribosome-recycling factor n=1 Tax=Natronogracilivirga saccharolytica TaxID=2812953 RepID=A0A8J7UWA1_9BACT|nr:ribosome recycling factor [Natronogracilivirga saccharolytica]MBP3192009.1 ribosome recycling factor [Natronogracilivirga saccharolytica]
MIPELQPFIDQAKEQMEDAKSFLKRELKHIRAGKASPQLLDGVKVDYYGTQTPLNQLANVAAPDPRLITVEPFDKSSMKNIEKAIMASGLGLNPNNDGTLIRIPLPVLSEERRQELAKVAKEKAEEARISIRNTRRDIKDEIKKEVKDQSLPEDSRYAAEEELQNLTDSHISEVDKMLKDKEDEIMTV